MPLRNAASDADESFGYSYTGANREQGAPQLRCTERDEEPEESRMAGTSVEVAVASWVAQLRDQVSVSASGVQDRLFDVWGLLPEGDARRVVGEWLTETLDRSLYVTDDIIARLEDLLVLADTRSSVG